MKAIKTTNPRRLIIFAIILVVVLGALLIWARDFVREVIVLPLSYLVWVVKVILYIVPETYFWMGAIAIGMLIAWRAVAGRSASSSGKSLGGAIDSAVIAQTQMRSRSMYLATRAAQTMAERQPLGTLPRSAPADQLLDPHVQVTRGRVAFWNNKVSLVRQGASPYYQSTFHVTLALFLLEMLAHRYRLTTSQVEARLRLEPESEQGRLLGLNVPNEVREYVLTRMRYRDLEAKPFWTRLRENLDELIGNISRSLAVLFHGSSASADVQPLDPRVERIIKYMEEELEVPHDDNGR